MERKNEKDEYLEVLWYMQENNEHTLAQFKEELADKYNQALLEQLVADNFVVLDNSRQTVGLSATGQDYTRKLIRSHRLAERLVHDVLSTAYEAGACEFEHIVNAELVDSICTLLGHPRECPHGLPIPEGECCRQKLQRVESSIIPLTGLEIGETAKIAYVYGQNDQQLHKLESLLIRPGINISLHQKRPTVVIECENATIALDEQVAANIHVWSPRRKTAPPQHPGPHKARRGYKHGQI